MLDNLISLGAPPGLVEAGAVKPQYQDLGVGRQMRHWALVAARQSHRYRPPARDRAPAFYESLGFQQRGMSFEVIWPEGSANVAAAEA